MSSPQHDRPNPLLGREAKRRLAVIRHVDEVTGNVAMTCRYFGISRKAYYIWYCRYQAEGVDGLRTRSKRPHTSPNATHVEVVGKIIYLRQNYHFEPEKIAMYLKRYHEITISKSGVWRILKCLDMGRLPASQRYKRLLLPPGGRSADHPPWRRVRRDVPRRGLERLVQERRGVFTLTGDHDFVLVGLRCSSIQRILHRMRGTRVQTAGAVEFGWTDGSHTAIDAAADWTLTISPRPWQDPFAAASAIEREKLEREVGLWVPEVPGPDDPLLQVIGRDITLVEPWMNKVGELTGLGISFGPIAVLARIVGGEVVIEVSPS